jgi:uncharacterized protein
MKIVIPGGSGQVGQILARHFHAGGHMVTVLSRSPRPAPWRVVSWDGATPGGWISEFEQSDVCINLAGRSVNCRYTPANRSIIYESRIQSTRLLHQVLSSLNRAPRLWVNASTATIYRHALDRAMNEAEGELGGNEPGAPDTWNFSIDVAKGWEEAFFSTPTPLTRKIAMRSAITLSPDRGGVFDVLLGLVRHGLGGTQGPGTQFVSWIHEADFVRAIDLLLKRDLAAWLISRHPTRSPIVISCEPCATRGASALACPTRNGSLKSARGSCGPNRNSFSRAAASCPAVCSPEASSFFFLSGLPRRGSWFLAGARTHVKTQTSHFLGCRGETIGAVREIRSTATERTTLAPPKSCSAFASPAADACQCLFRASRICSSCMIIYLVE